MRFLIVLTLLILPITVVQLYSTDSLALTSKVEQQGKLNNKPVLPGRQVADINASLEDGIYSNKSSETQVDTEPVKSNTDPVSKTKKVRIVEGKKNSQGMQLLSVLLLLKDKNK